VDDRAEERDVVEFSVLNGFQVNWFRPDRPVAGGTTFRRPPDLGQKSTVGEDDASS